jgi:hypothetical protein
MRGIIFRAGVMSICWYSIYPPGEQTIKVLARNSIILFNKMYNMGGFVCLRGLGEGGFESGVRREASTHSLFAYQ